MSTLGDKKGDHWAIHANVFAIHSEKGEPDIYSSKNIEKLEEQLTERAMPRQCKIKSPTKEYKKLPSIHDCSASVGKGNGSSKDSASVASDSGGVSSNGQDEGPGRQHEGSSSSQSFVSR